MWTEIESNEMKPLILKFPETTEFILQGAICFKSYRTCGELSWVLGK